ncbi:MAG: S8 family serine peptidase [Anaerolineales bacterium]
MHRRKHGLLSLLSIASLVLAAVGVMPAAATSLQDPPPPFDRSVLQPRRPSVPANGTDGRAPVDAPLALVSGPVKIIVELQDDPAVVVYNAAQSGGGSKLQATAAAAEQLAAINQAQATVSTALQSLGAQEIYRAQRVYNGIAVLVDASQIGAISSLPNVKAIHALIPKTLALKSSVPLIGAPALWDPIGPNATGTGVKIGIIDSGIDYEHADFGGYGVVSPTIYADNDTTVVGDVPGFPSAKVVGGTDLVGDDYDADPTSATYQPVPHPDPDPSSCLTGGESADHGTHVAGIAAGYGVITTGTTYAGPYNTTLNQNLFRIGPGVAPNAELYSIRVFGCDGSTDVVVEALDWAVDPNGDSDFSDHLDVVNMSLGSDYGSYYDADAVASDNAVLAGVIVVASSGNAGNQYYITGSPAVSGRTISVASSRDGQAIVDGFKVVSGTLAGVQPGLEAAAYDWLTTTLPITGALVYPAVGPDPAHDQRTGCYTFTAANVAAITGKVVLLDWSEPSCGGSVTRTGNAVAAGAIGVLIADNSEVFDLSITGSAVVPSLSIPKATGDDLKANLPLTVVFSHEYHAKIQLDDSTWIDTMSDFSSRGPRIRDSAIKPDITAPGDTIFSALNATGNEGASFNGTSMAAPHVTGAMALLRELHPLWSVEELKALAMNTSLHDLRLEPPMTSTVFGPARSGAGRIDLANTKNTDQVAFNSGAPGQVSVSFGAQEVLDTTTLVRSIRVENKGLFSIDYNVSFSSTFNTPGVTFSVSPSFLTVPANDFRTVVVTMTAVAASMDRTTDPSFDPGADGSGMSEATGYVVIDPNVVAVTSAPSALLIPSILRVPVYVAARPVSNMSAESGSIGYGIDSEIVLTGTGIQTGGQFDPPPDLTSLVVPFELQYHNSGDPTGIQYLDIAQIKSVGITSDFEGEGSITDTIIYIGISTFGNWSTPYAADTEFDVYFDIDRDGTEDFVLYNTVLPDTTTFLSRLIDLNTFDAVYEDYINGIPGTAVDTAVFNNSVMVLPVYAADMGIAPGNARFDYYVASGPRETSPSYSDFSTLMTYDPENPGLDFNGGFPGIPVWVDLPGEVIPVTYPSLAAFQANGSQGVLLLHLHNGFSNREEILQVNVPTIYMPLIAR